MEIVHRSAWITIPGLAHRAAGIRSPGLAGNPPRSSYSRSSMCAQARGPLKPFSIGEVFSGNAAFPRLMLIIGVRQEAEILARDRGTVQSSLAILAIGDLVIQYLLEHAAKSHGAHTDSDLLRDTHSKCRLKTLWVASPPNES